MDSFATYNPNDPTCHSYGRVGVDTEHCPGPGPYCSRCKFCKERGHSSTTCPMECGHCRGKGHLQRRCPVLMGLTTLNPRPRRLLGTLQIQQNDHLPLTDTTPCKRKQHQHLQEDYAPVSAGAGERQYRRWFSLNISVVCPGLGNKSPDSEVTWLWALSNTSSLRC